MMRGCPGRHVVAGTGAAKADRVVLQTNQRDLEIGPPEVLNT
jgi:hypothetical protein